MDQSNKFNPNWKLQEQQSDATNPNELNRKKKNLQGVRGTGQGLKKGKSGRMNHRCAVTSIRRTSAWTCLRCYDPEAFFNDPNSLWWRRREWPRRLKRQRREGQLSMLQWGRWEDRPMLSLLLEEGSRGCCCYLWLEFESEGKSRKEGKKIGEKKVS